VSSHYAIAILGLVQVAMKLYHLQEKDKYFHWSIASNFLLAGGSPFVQDGEVKRSHSSDSLFPLILPILTPYLASAGSAKLLSLLLMDVS